MDCWESAWKSENEIEKRPFLSLFAYGYLVCLLGAQTVLSGARDAKQAAPVISQICHAKRPGVLLAMQPSSLVPYQEIIIILSCPQAIKSLCYQFKCREAAPTERNGE